MGDVYRFLAVGDDMGGHYAQWEATIPPGGGPPPHISPPTKSEVEQLLAVAQRYGIAIKHD